MRRVLRGLESVGERIDQQVGNSQGDAHSRHEPVRELGAPELRIDDGRGRRERRRDLVMIGDYRVDPHVEGSGDEGAVAHAAVDGDDELHGGARQSFQLSRVQSVPLGPPVGNVRERRGAELDERVEHHGGRADAVGVVVPVHGDQLPACESRSDPVDHALGVGQ